MLSGILLNPTKFIGFGWKYLMGLKKLIYGMLSARFELATSPFFLLSMKGAFIRKPFFFLYTKGALYQLS